MKAKLKGHIAMAMALTILTTATLSAQQTLTLRGELDEGKSTGCYYCPNVPWTIKFSETPVRSKTIDLKPFKDASAQLILTGYWDRSVTPHGLEVTSVQVVTESLSVNNSARTGQPLRYTTYGPSDSVAATVIASGNGFVPLFGTALLLDPASLFLLGANVINGGQWRFDLVIPSDPSLIGIRFWSQSLVVPPNAAPYSTNPGRTTVDR